MTRASQRTCIGLLLAGLSAAWNPSQAATVADVQRGSVTSSGNGTLTVNLADPVDPAASVLFFSTRHSDALPQNSAVRGRLASSTTLEFDRVTPSPSDIEISWYLVEFASGVKVQRGQVAQTGNNLDVPLAEPVANTEQAFVLYSKTPAMGGDSDWDSNDPIGGYVRNATSLRFRTDAANGHLIDYQVVEFTDPADILVQSGETNVPNGATSVNVNLPQSIDPASTFILAGHTIDNGGFDVEARLLASEVVDEDTIRFSRGGTGNDIGRVVWQVIELKDGSRVLHGTETFTWLQGSATVTLPEPVDPARAVAFSGMQSYGGQSLGAAGPTFFVNHPGVASFTFDLAPDELGIERVPSWYAASVGWFVVAFNDAAPPVPVLDVPMNELAWSGATGEVTDAAGGNNGDARNGVATEGVDPAVAGDPGTCRYGDFDGADDYLAFADASYLDASDELTVGIWINARARPASGISTIVSKDTNYEFHLDTAGRIYWWWNDASGTVRSLTSSAAVALNSWHHVAVTYTFGSQVIYLDGMPVATASHTGTLRNNDLELQVGQDQGLAGRFWNGRFDELKIYDQALDAAEVQALMSATRPCLTGPVADWRFDEAGWNGTPDEVLDYSGNGRHGTASSIVTDTGLVCRAAEFGADGTGGYLTLDAAAFDGLTDFTLTTWYRGTQTSAMSIVSGANAAELNELIYFFWAPDRFDPHVKGGEAADIVPPVALDDGNWHFLAWTRSGTNNCLYADGALAECGARPGGVLDIDSVVAGQEQDSLGGGFDADQDVEGDLDELLLFDRALADGELAAIRANHLAGLNWDGSPRACPAPAVASFVLAHDGAGIHCADEAIAVTAVDVVGAVVTGYVGQISLDTTTGRGNWSIVSGGGLLSGAAGDDGVATYLFAPGDNGTVTFALSYPEGPALVDVDVSQTDDPTLRDDDAEGALTFAPTGFTVTADALPNPPPGPITDPIPPQIASQVFDVHLTAFGVTEDDPQCGVIESYAGARNLTFTMDHVDPDAGTRVASVDGQAAGSGSQAVTFTAGQAVVTVDYKDAGAIRLAVEDAASFPSALNGASNAFVVSPAALLVSRVESAAGTANPGASTATGPGFVAAGTPFRVDVDAVDAAGNVTPNFGRETAPEVVGVTLDGIAVPATGAVGSVLNGAAFAASAVPGRFTNTAVVFDEVGVIRLRAEIADGDYLGAGPVSGVVSGPVGRFHPAAFDLVSANVTPACGTFTYMGHPSMSLQYRLRALNAGGATTLNYDAAALGAAAVADLTYSAEAANGGFDLGPRLSAIGGTWVAGEVSVVRNDLAFARLSAPDGPYDPLQLGLTVTDPLDGVPLLGLDTNPATSSDCLTAGDCSARALGAGQRIVYGRLAVLPVSGPENENLSVPLAAQVFTGAAFERNPADACSAYDAVAMALGGYAGNLQAGETSVVGPAGTTLLSAGIADPADPPELAAPGFGNDGSIEVTLNVPSWLEFDWLGVGVTDPAATATFGSFRGHDRIIYRGEPR